MPAPDRADAVVPVLSDNVEKSAGLIGDGVAFTHAAREFHDLLVELTPNATVRYVVRSLVALWSVQEETWAEALTRRGDYFSEVEAKRAVRAHQRIIAEISAGRAAEAQRVARARQAIQRSGI